MDSLWRVMSAALGALALWPVAAALAMPLSITNASITGGNPRLLIQSDVGITNQIQCKTNLNQSGWLELTNLVVAQSPYVYVDASTPPASMRFYRVGVAAPAGMALIPGGIFTMGNCMNTNEGSPDELPLHAVDVSPFYMDTNLVSYALWQQVYQWAITNGYSFDNAGSSQASNHPVEYLFWYDCVKWCNARSEKDGLVPAYYTSAAQTNVYRMGQTNLDSASVKWNAGYRLPTEAEWEKAARGGVSGHRFPWSDADTVNWSRANYYASPGSPGYDVNPIPGYDTDFNNGGYPYTSPEGFFAPNEYGLYDMAGNLWEWCWDWYGSGYYSASPGTDPRGAVSGAYRVQRGGSWGYYASASRCASRLGTIVPGYGSVVSGFRCVRGL
jgi:formylglycine-generating enzyme required for sulfatase activity